MILSVRPSRKLIERRRRKLSARRRRKLSARRRRKLSVRRRRKLNVRSVKLLRRSRSKTKSVKLLKRLSERLWRPNDSCVNSRNVARRPRRRRGKRQKVGLAKLLRRR
jgi:hypothetical protein